MSVVSYASFVSHVKAQLFGVPIGPLAQTEIPADGTGMSLLNSCLGPLWVPLSGGALEGPSLSQQKLSLRRKVGGEVEKFIEDEYTEIVVLGDITGLE